MDTNEVRKDFCFVSSEGKEYENDSTVLVERSADGLIRLNLFAANYGGTRVVDLFIETSTGVNEVRIASIRGSKMLLNLFAKGKFTFKAKVYVNPNSTIPSGTPTGISNLDTLRVRTTQELGDFSKLDKEFSITVDCH